MNRLGNGHGPVMSPAPSCPACSGPMFDNRNRTDRAAHPRSPAFRCQDPNCVDPKGQRTAIWRASPNGAVAGNGNGNGHAKPAAPAPAEISSDERVAALLRLHRRCLAYVIQHELPMLREALGSNALLADAIVAASATVYIAISKESR
jgi:hypothetical protein